MYVSRYDGSRPGYFAGWVDGAALVMRSGHKAPLPRFGATLETAARYVTSEEARAQVVAMPLVAGVMCDVEKVGES